MFRHAQKSWIATLREILWYHRECTPWPNVSNGNNPSSALDLSPAACIKGHVYFGQPAKNQSLPPSWICRRLGYIPLLGRSGSVRELPNSNRYLPQIHSEEDIVNPRAALTAAETGVEVRVVAALRLCAMCALTRWPAASAEHKLSSPARTAAATIRASCRALSPGLVGWEPRTPSISSMADCASRIVPPPIVPTSMEGIDTAIWRLPLRLRKLAS